MAPRATLPSPRPSSPMAPGFCHPAGAAASFLMLGLRAQRQPGPALRSLCRHVHDKRGPGWLLGPGQLPSVAPAAGQSAPPPAAWTTSPGKGAWLPSLPGSLLTRQLCPLAGDAWLPSPALAVGGSGGQARPVPSSHAPLALTAACFRSEQEGGRGPGFLAHLYFCSRNYCELGRPLGPSVPTWAWWAPSLRMA